MMFWTSILLLIAIGGPLELRLRVAAQFLQQDLIDRSTAVINDIAADLGAKEFLEDQDVEEQLLTEVFRAPSIVELSVIETTTTGDRRLVASTVNAPDFTLNDIGGVLVQPLERKGARGERVMIIGRSFPNHPQVMIVAATTLEDLDRFNSLNRRTAFVFTLGSIAAAVLLLNYIYRRKIEQPIDEIRTVIAQAHLGAYNARVGTVREDEIGQVAEAFNELLGRVEIRTEEKNRLIAEATRGMLESQNRLIQAERLATAGQMASTFAHEIGSPLASLSAHAELLLEDPDTTSHQKEAVALMHKQIRRVTQIVDDLLRSSRRGPEDFMPVNTVEIVNDVLKLVLPRLRAENIQVVNELPDALHVRGYALYLQEVFLNLINNAAEAIEHDGVVTLAGGTDAGKVWIEVRDTGPGIDPKIVDDVWKQFVTTKEMRNGTGLGLAVVRDIVKQHGGEVTLQTSHQGTNVRVSLPALKHSTISV
jgi:signal transduction histidine kinase